MVPFLEKNENTTCQEAGDMVIYSLVTGGRSNEAIAVAGSGRKLVCRNGRRGRLKICCGQPRVGSSPTTSMKLKTGNPKRECQNCLTLSKNLRCSFTFLYSADHSNRRVRRRILFF